MEQVIFGVLYRYRDIMKQESLVLDGIDGMQGFVA